MTEPNQPVSQGKCRSTMHGWGNHPSTNCYRVHRCRCPGCEAAMITYRETEYAKRKTEEYRSRVRVVPRSRLPEGPLTEQEVERLRQLVGHHPGKRYQE